MLDVQGIYFFTLCCVRLRYFRSLLRAFIEVLNCWSRGRENFLQRSYWAKKIHSHISLFVINPLQVSDHKFGVGNNKYMEKSTIHVFQDMEWNGP